MVAPTIDGLPARWDEAIGHAARLIAAAIQKGGDSVGVVFSPQHTNEDNFALARLAREMWGIRRFYVGGKAPVPERADKILRDADINPNRRGVKAVLG
jgi:NADH-quinone oxidoreductase subunit G